MLREKIESLVKESIGKSLEEGVLGDLQSVPDTVPVDFTKNPEHGDRAISIAMKLSKDAKIAPRNIAQAIAEHLPKEMFKKVDIAGPGFINLTLDWDLLEEVISDIHKKDEAYGRASEEQRPDTNYKSIIVEYVSANPTGDLHLGHGRGAVLGSALVELLKWAGYDVKSEFYINDAGVQIKKLGNSFMQALEIKAGKLEESNYEEENYPLDAMNEVLASHSELINRHSEPTARHSERSEESLNTDNCAEIAKKYYLEAQRKVLENAKVVFDKWYSEKDEIHAQGKIEEVCKILAEKGDRKSVV